jgi:hypothetical protein
MQRALTDSFEKSKKQKTEPNEDDEEFYETKIDEEGNLIEEDTDEEIDIDKLNIPTLQPKKTQSWQPTIQSTMRSATSADCAYREGSLCTKKEIRISLDDRGHLKGKTKDGKGCWERMFCDHYKKIE